MCEEIEISSFLRQARYNRAYGSLKLTKIFLLG